MSQMCEYFKELDPISLQRHTRNQASSLKQANSLSDLNNALKRFLLSSALLERLTF